MTSRDPTLKFVELPYQEKLSRLNSLASFNKNVIVWEKGQKTKISCDVVSYDGDVQQLELNGPANLGLMNHKKLLISFNLSGLSYFTQGKLLIKNNKYYLQDLEALFKGERRSDFRLQANPLFKLKATLDVSDTYERQSNVVKFKQSVSETKLFRNFLKIIGQANNQGTLKVNMKVQDLSASGMSLLVSGVEKELFSKGAVIKDIFINISKEQSIRIRKARVTYVIDYVNGLKLLKKQYQVGLHFFDNTKEEERFLREKVNALFGSTELNKKFEEFIT